VLGEHRPLLQHRPGVAQHPVDRHTGDAGDLFGGLAGADPGLDVAGGQGRHRVAGRHHAGHGGHRCGAVGVQDRADPVVDRERQEPADLVGEHQGLTVLGKGDEANRPHALPPSVSLACAPESQPHPGAFEITVRRSVTRWG
jgi:hypothetical protein